MCAHLSHAYMLSQNWELHVKKHKSLLKLTFLEIYLTQCQHTVRLLLMLMIYKVNKINSSVIKLNVFCVLLYLKILCHINLTSSNLLNTKIKLIFFNLQIVSWLRCQGGQKEIVRELLYVARTWCGTLFGTAGLNTDDASARKEGTRKRHCLLC